MAAGVVIILLILVAIFADQLSALYGQNYRDHHSVGAGSLLDPATNLPTGALGGISSSHWLGVSPVLGQDIMAQLMQGAEG